MDLADKLLSYDPSQRLTASQALLHPFFQGVECLMQGAASVRQLDASRVWQEGLQAVFDQYVTTRNGAMLALMPTLENAIHGHLNAESSPADFERLVAQVGAPRHISPRLALPRHASPWPPAWS